MILLRAAVTALAFWVAGCAPLAVVGPDLSAGAGAVQAFTLGGRLSIRQGDHNDVVRIAWQHAPSREHIALSTPLGGQVLALDVLPGLARLQLPDRAPIEAADDQALMQSVLGYALPVRGLAGWVSGQVDAQYVTHADGDGEARTVQFSSAGWQGTLQRWRRVGQSDLPGLVAVQRGDLSLRLVVDQWTVQRVDP